jgi:hypothetical protein
VDRAEGRRAVLGFADYLEALGLEERARIRAEARMVVDDEDVHAVLIVAGRGRGHHTVNRTLDRFSA